MADHPPALAAPADARRQARGQVQSVARALDLLEALIEHDQQSLGQLACRTGLSPSTAHRLLATLVARGYVIQEHSSGSYLAAARARRATSAGQEPRDVLRSIARPYLERASKISGETANLAILEDDTVLYLDRVRGRHPVPMSMRTGRSIPAHAAAAGKALLAEQPGDAAALLARPEPFRRLTSGTITTARRLEAALRLARQRGDAIDDEEQQVGVTCVAAPVLGHSGKPVAAISVSGSTQRLQATGLDELGELLIILTQELSARLQHADPAQAA
jgi:IclR family acetate operon transcriptional repressor